MIDQRWGCTDVPCSDGCSKERRAEKSSQGVAVGQRQRGHGGASVSARGLPPVATPGFCSIRD